MNKGRDHTLAEQIQTRGARRASKVQNRKSRSLAGSWQFQLDPDGTLTVQSLSPDREIQVPMPWQAACPDLEHYGGYAWYRLHVDLAKDWLGGQLLLHFGAVDYWCEVYVNGALAGEHEGGYTPFDVPIGAHARQGPNEITIRVYDPVQTGIQIPRWPLGKDDGRGTTENGSKDTGSPSASPSTADAHTPSSIVHRPSSGAGRGPFDANQVPHGKQDWYINVGGIWQDVTLTSLPPTYIEYLRVTPDIHTGEAHVQIEVAGDTDHLADGKLEVIVQARNGDAWQQTIDLDAAGPTYTATVTVPQPDLWSPESPTLYTAIALLDLPGGHDEKSARFGFREIATREGRLLLNGQPFYLLSALDQDFYPDTIYTVPSEAYLRDQFRKARALGFNNLRCHIKPPDPLYLDLADEMGLTVWEEIPSWRTFAPKDTTDPAYLHLSPDVKERVAATLAEMVRRDYNHASLIIWTIVNEDWGTFLPLSAEDRRWVSEMYDLCKELDPTRLVTDNSACPAPWGPNIHVKTDLDDFHIYANIPDQARGFEHTVSQLNLRPGWTFSAHGDAQRTGSEPLILSEFGNWGLPSMELLKEPDGSEPSWFRTGPWWSRWDGDPGWPTGVEERFRSLGLDAIWPDYEAFATATQWHQFAALKFEIEVLRRQAQIEGYVVTEFTDAYWEANGLLDFERNPKAYFGLFSQLNAPDVIMATTPRHVFWDDESVQVQLHGSHYGDSDWSGARLRWSSAAATPSGERPVPGLARGSSSFLGTANWPLPKVDKAQPFFVDLSLQSRQGRKLAENSLELLVLPHEARVAAYEGRMAVITADEPPTEPLPEPPNTQTLDEAMEAKPHGETSSGAAFPPPPDEQEVPQSDLGRALGGLGYRVTGRITADTGVAVATYVGPGLLKWVRDGGDLLYITRSAGPFFWVQGRGGSYGGNWITAYSWLRPDVYRRLSSVSSPLGMPFIGVMPPATILGLPVENPAAQEDFLGGMIMGWVRHPAVHTVQFRYGSGRVIMTTFPLDQALPGDPAGVALLHDLVDHLTSDACRPTVVASRATN
ncbi:MAG: glycoside hydrolase family 2 protein [Chloroflexia bacterium]